MNKPATDDLNKLKEKFDYHVFLYNSPGYNSANDFKTKEYLKWIYEKLLLNFNTVLSAPKLSVYQSRLSTWEKRGIKPQIKFIQEIFQDVECEAEKTFSTGQNIKNKESKKNFFTDFEIKDKYKTQLSEFLKYLKKQNYINIDEDKIYLPDFKIQYLKENHTAFCIAFYRFIQNNFINNSDLIYPWKTIEKYFTNKNNESVKHKQLGNKNNSDEYQDSIEKQSELIESLHDDFLSEIE